MQNTERQKFEENWKSAFDGAETTPSDRVWSSIDLELTGAESATMKRRVVFYQRVAAATVFLSILSGVYAFWPREVVSSQETVVSSQETVGSSQETVVSSQEQGAGNEVSSNEKIEVEVAKPAKVVRKTTPLDPTVDNSQPVALAEGTDNTIMFDLPEPAAIIQEEKIEEEKIEKKRTEETVAVASPLLQTSQDPEEIIQPKRRNARETNLWLSLGASAGNYTPNTPNSSALSMQSFAKGPASADYNYLSNVKPAPSPKAPKVGTSYTFGMAVGKKFGRIVVQTGVNFGRQQIEYASNYDTKSSPNSAKAATSDYLASEYSDGNINVTTPYTANSTMEIVSLPVQAGYMIVDRKLGWQVNAGISPDFFLRNVITDQSGQRERFTQSAGTGSPYRSVNWSGLLNTELSYRIGQHYRLSLVPGVTYSFNSILKEPTSNGKPVILDVGFRFRYLFE